MLFSSVAMAIIATSGALQELYKELKCKVDLTMSSDCDVVLNKWVTSRYPPAATAAAAVGIEATLWSVRRYCASA